MKVTMWVLSLALLSLVAIRLLVSRSSTPAEFRNAHSDMSSGREFLVGAPTATYEADLGKPYIHLTWDYSSASNFNIYRATAPDGPWSRINQQAYPSDAHSAVDYAFPKDSRIIYYRVVPIDASGKEGAPSSPTVLALPSH